MKKKLALLLAAVMLLTLVLAGCGSNTTPAPAASAAPAESAAPASEAPASEAPADAAATEYPAYNIGASVWGAGVPIIDLIQAAREYVFAYCGCDYSTASDDFTSDKELANAQSLVASGVDGICFWPCVSTLAPTVAQIFADAKIPFTFDTAIGTEDVRADLAANNEYYLGSCEANCTFAGQQMAERAYADGCRKALLIAGNLGDPNHDARVDGFTETFESLGGEVLAAARCSDPSETTTKMEDMASAHRDVDCVFGGAGDYTPGAISALENLGIEGVKIYIANVDEDTANLIKEGKVVAGNDGTTLPPILCATLVMNYLDGCKIVDADGKAATYQTTPMEVDATNVDLYLDVFFNENGMPVGDSILNTLLYRYNPDVSYDTYMDTINNVFTLENLGAALGLN